LHKSCEKRLPAKAKLLRIFGGFLKGGPWWAVIPAPAPADGEHRSWADPAYPTDLGGLLGGAFAVIYAIR
jgi:hypothetical protein